MPLTQEDSLVFADDTKWSDRKKWPVSPDTFGLFHSPSLPNEPTQIDQSTSPVFRHGSFSSSNDSYDVSPIAKRRLLTPSNDKPHEKSQAHEVLRSRLTSSTENPSTLDKTEDTQLIGPNEDTQLINSSRATGSLMHGHSIHKSKQPQIVHEKVQNVSVEPQTLKTSLNTPTIIEHSNKMIATNLPGDVHDKESRHSEKHLLQKYKPDLRPNTSTDIADTQLLYPHHLLEGDTQVIIPLRKVVENDSQIIFSPNKSIAEDTHGLVSQSKTIHDDTQIIPQLGRTPADQVISPVDYYSELQQPSRTKESQGASFLLRNDLHNSTHLSSFQKEQLKSFDALNTSKTRDNSMERTEDGQVLFNPSSDHALHTIEWGNTQPITQVSNLQPEETNGVDMRSSPTKKSEPEADTTTLVLSQGSEGRIREEPTTQVVNTQEEFIDHTINTIDIGGKSIFSSSQNGRATNAEVSIISNDEYAQTDVDTVLLIEDSVDAHKRKRQKLIEEAEGNATKSSQTLAFGDSGGNNGLSEPTSSLKKGSHSETYDSQLALASISATLTRKLDWSQSSSELEDFSHDVKFDVDMLESENYEALPDYEESHVEILVPRRRRSNQILESQSQSQSQNRSGFESQYDSQDELQSQPRSPLQSQFHSGSQIEPKELRAEPLNVLLVKHIHNPQSVWALSQFKFYPARVLSLTDLVSKVEFCDFVQTEMKNVDLYLLDLRVGDIVLLNLRLGEFIVTGLVHSYEQSNFKCVRGYDTAIVVKKGRHGNAQGKEFSVGISQLFMDMGMRASHQLRYRLMCEDIDLVQESYSIVKDVLSNQDVGISDLLSDERIVVQSEGPKLTSQKMTVQSNVVPIKSTLFNQMVFFVTSVNDARKGELCKLITSNGGIFIDDEIKLFVTKEESETNHLCLTLSRFEGLKFGALLSDGYSRSAKYLQALALGWPILADSFVDQAIADPKVLNNWSVYLLPAGHSFHINGLKSNDVYKFREKLYRGEDLNKQLSNNSSLLMAESIIILDKKQDQKTLEMCEFIFHAFGAKAMKFCKTVSAIDTALKELEGQNVLVYDNSSNEYAKRMSKNTAKRSDLMGKPIGIIGWEWLVQCVISCYIWQPDCQVNI